MTLAAVIGTAVYCVPNAKGLSVETMIGIWASLLVLLLLLWFSRLARTRELWSAVACVSAGAAAIMSWMRSPSSLESMIYPILFAAFAYDPAVTLVRMARAKGTKTLRTGR
jgi:hypothetical protein